MKYTAIILLLIAFTASAETVTYTCNYPTYSDHDGIHKVEGGFELTFLIDKEKKKSYLIGNNGSSEVLLVPSEEQLAFVEFTKSGNVMSTAIDSKLNSVHSRNSVLYGELLPSQYYGKCREK